MNLISFLGKRFKRFFSSGQKVPTSKFRWLILMGVLCVVPWQKAEAGIGDNECWQNNYNTISWNSSTGCIQYKVRYWQNWGACGVGKHWSGWRSDEGGIKIKQKSNPEKNWTIKCKEEGDIDTNEPGGSVKKDIGNSYRPSAAIRHCQPSGPFRYIHPCFQKEAFRRSHGSHEQLHI